MAAETTFTLFVSGAFSDNAPHYNKMVDPDLPIIQLNVTESYTISLNNKLTNYAVESRSSISDHIFSENIRLQMQASIGYTEPYNNAYGNLIKTSDKSNVIKSNRPQQAYELLKKLRDERLQFDVLTEQELFEDMVITDLGVAKNAGDDQLNFSISLEKPRFVEVGKTVLAQIAPIKTSNKSVKNKTSDKKPDGAKNSGDLAKEEKKMVFGTQSDWATNLLKEGGFTPRYEDMPEDVK